MKILKTKSITLLLVGLLGTTISFAQQPLLTPLDQQGKPQPTGDRLTHLEARLERLERVFENQVLRELIQGFDQLQQEVRELRGDLEAQYNEIDKMQKRQRDLYVDTDRRLRDIEVGGPRTATGAGSDTSAAPPPDSGTPTAGSQSSQTTVATTQTTQSDSGGPDEKAAYQSAFEFLKTGQYPQAITAYQNFLQRYPDGRYAANAQYWLGEANYVSRAFDKALQQFQTVVQTHPSSPKVPDARLKIGFALYEMERWEDARQALTSVIQDFPNSSVARLSQQRLVRMKKEGR